MRPCALIVAITLRMSFRPQRPEWGGRFALRRRPVEAILLSDRALELLRVLRSSARVRVRAGVLPLRGHVSPANTDGVEFVLPNVPVDDLLLARRGVEMPLPVHFHQRNRHREVVRANLKNDSVVPLFHRLAAL